MEDREDIDDAVTGFKVGLDAVRQRLAGVRQQQLVFLFRVVTDVAARYYPQNVVVVKGYVPLHVTRSSFEDVVDIALKGGGVDGVVVSMPLRGAAVTNRIAHHHHLGYRGVSHAKQLRADSLNVRFQPHLHRRRRFLIDPADQRRSLEHQTGLRTRLPLASWRVAPFSHGPPMFALLVHERFVSLANFHKFRSGYGFLYDHVAFFEESIPIHRMHHASSESYTVCAPWQWPDGLDYVPTNVSGHFGS